MNYRSLADINSAVINGMMRMPQPIDVVVGIPRSGLLPANLLCLALNIPLADLDGFCAGRVLSTGTTRQREGFLSPLEKKCRVVVIDDSINSGSAMRQARAAVEAAGLDAEITFVAVYGNGRSHPDADLVLEAIPRPHFFQWNIMHHDILEHACVDIDGVLCLDPTDIEDDDGVNYDRFLRNATPLWRPTRPIGRLVTSRIEKYRPQTEQWIRKWGIEYRELHMLDLPSRAERLSLGVDGRFKAQIYSRTDSLLFIESTHHQALEIAQISGKPVLCTCCFELFRPGQPDFNTLCQNLRTAPKRLKLAYFPLIDREALKKTARGVIGEHAYMFLKRLAGRRGSN